MATGNYTEERISVGDTELYLTKGGSGAPLLVLHGVEGHEGWLAFHEALAANATVYAPASPGYTPTERPEWLTSITHQAVFYHWFIEQQGLGPVDVVGLGMGGWICRPNGRLMSRQSAKDGPGEPGWHPTGER